MPSQCPGNADDLAPPLYATLLLRSATAQLIDMAEGGDFQYADLFLNAAEYTFGPPLHVNDVFPDNSMGDFELNASQPDSANAYR